MTTDELLPLFPLEVVLFPGTELPLHIFEPRYRLLIGEALEGHSEFGIILARESKLAPFGCTAMVERVTKRHDDGRFDIETRGRRRFQALELNTNLPYLRARVEYFDDAVAGSFDRAQVEQIEELARRLAALVGVSEPEPMDRSLPQPSFHIAHALPLDLDFKQRLLATRSEKERLDDLLSGLPELIEHVASTQSNKPVTGTNGHVPSR